MKDREAVAAALEPLDQWATETREDSTLGKPIDQYPSEILYHIEVLDPRTDQWTQIGAQYGGPLEPARIDRLLSNFNGLRPKGSDPATMIRRVRTELFIGPIEHR